MVYYYIVNFHVFFSDFLFLLVAFPFRSILYQVHPGTMSGWWWLEPNHQAELENPKP